MFVRRLPSPIKKPSVCMLKVVVFPFSVTSCRVDATTVPPYFFVFLPTEHGILYLYATFSFREIIWFRRCLWGVGYVESTLSIHLHALLKHGKEDGPVIYDVVYSRVILLTSSLAHDSSYGLHDVRFGCGQNHGVETRDVQTLMRLTERREYDLFRAGLCEFLLLHATHVQP